MSKIVIYTKDHCPYCVMAKNLLTQKGVSFEEHNIEGRFDELDALKRKTGHMTVPQIFIGEKFIGGYSDMAALEAKGELDSLIK